MLLVLIEIMAGEYLEVSENIWDGFFSDEGTTRNTSKNPMARATIYGLIEGGTLDPRYACEDLIGWARSFAIKEKNREIIDFFYHVARALDIKYDKKKTRETLKVCADYLGKFDEFDETIEDAEREDAESKEILEKIRRKTERPPE